MLGWLEQHEETRGKCVLRAKTEHTNRMACQAQGRLLM